MKSSYNVYYNKEMCLNYVQNVKKNSHFVGLHFFMPFYVVSCLSAALHILKIFHRCVKLVQ